MQRPIFIRFMLGVSSIFFTIIEILLASRLILVFFNADSTNAFVSFIYKYSDYLVSPFNGVFGSIKVFDSFTLDLDALLAWFVYLVAFFLIVEILKFLGDLFTRR